MQKLFEHDFGRTDYKFTINLPIQIRIIYNVKIRHAIHLKFGDKFLIFLAKLLLKSKANMCSMIKENLLWYCFIVYLYCFWHLLSLSELNIFLWQGLHYKETPLAIETINITNESLAFQNRHLNDALSIPDVLDLKKKHQYPRNLF